MNEINIAELQNTVPPTQQIQKYRLSKKRGDFTIKMPIDWQWIKIAMQYNEPTMWIVGDPNAELADFTFTALFTGDHIPPELMYSHMDSLIMDGDSYVLHYFGKS